MEMGRGGGDGKEDVWFGGGVGLGGKVGCFGSN